MVEMQLAAAVVAAVEARANGQVSERLQSQLQPWWRKHGLHWVQWRPWRCHRPCTASRRWLGWLFPSQSWQGWEHLPWLLV